MKYVLHYDVAALVLTVIILIRFFYKKSILTSPVTKLIFYYNRTEGYCHRPGFALLYAATSIYMAATMFLVAKYRAVLTRWQITSVCFYLLASLLGMILQVILPNILLLRFAVSMSPLLLYMPLESPDDDEGKFPGIYNHRGFEKMITYEVGKQADFHVTVMNITNYFPIREAVGMDSVDYFTTVPFESSDREVRHMNGQNLESRKRICRQNWRRPDIFAKERSLL